MRGRETRGGCAGSRPWSALALPPLASVCLLLTFVAGQLDMTGSGGGMGAAAGSGAEREPEFLLPLNNITVAQGRDVHFTCIVNRLGNYKVAWIKSDTKTILAIHTLMVTQNSRLSVTHNGHNTWKLYVSNVQPRDSGTYMCQVNTDPMKSQMGHLSVVVPPDIADTASTSAEATEGGSVELQCAASGEPAPAISWRRDNGRHIVLRDDTGTELQVVESVAGSRLRLVGVQRADMGQYQCIASNGVPPTQSKRYDVTVLFSPVVRVANPIVEGAVGTAATLSCYVEASPKSLNTWLQRSANSLARGHHNMQLGGGGVSGEGRRKASEVPLNEYALRMSLTIESLHKADFGDYSCAALNAFGSAEGTVRLHEIEVKTTTTTTTSTTTTTTTPQPTSASTVVVPRIRKKPKSKSEPASVQGQGQNSIALEERTYSGVAASGATPANNSHDYSYRGDKLKVRPSGPPRYVNYNNGGGDSGARAILSHSLCILCALYALVSITIW